jgi:lysophospholipase L1-like esterase
MTRAEFFEAGSDGWLYDNGTEKVAVTNNKTALYAAKIAVTYARAHNRADDFVQENKMSRLTTFKNKIENGEDAKILLIGDSITAGAGVQNFPNWGAMLKDAVEARSESEITLITAGIPGIHSQQYIDLLNGTELTGDAYFLGEVAQKKPLVAAHKATADLIVIAIGGNDAGGWNGATGVNNTVYRNNVKTMIDFFRTANPDCSVMLVSCFQTHDKIWTNGTTKLAAADLKAYAGELATIEFDKGYANSSNLIFADVFSMQENILNVRKAEDLLGDNRNHPDDYMSRIYVQTMVAALFGK